MNEGSGLPQCCGEDMLHLKQSNVHWCEACDRRIPAEAIKPTTFESQTYEGRGLCNDGKPPIETHIMQMRDPNCWVHSSKARWLQAYIDANGFYLQDTRQIVGNCVLWWEKDHKGYTTELSKAHVFTAEEVKRYTDRDTDLPWPKAVVDAAAVTHCRIEPLRRWQDTQGQKPERQPLKCKQCMDRGWVGTEGGDEKPCNCPAGREFKETSE